MRTRTLPQILALALVFSLTLTGCFEIEQSLELDRNMSGTADLDIGIDFEPMILIMATMKRQMEGKEGPPTSEELAAARAEFKAESEAEEGEELPTLAEANSQMPEGVELIDLGMKEGDTDVRTHFKFRFDHLKKLVGLQLPTKGGEGEATPDQGVLNSPFENLELVENGNTFTIRTKPANPAADVEEQIESQGASPDPEMEKMMKEAFEGMKLTWKIKAPFEVVSHNATRVEGDTLVWVYDFETLEKLGESDSAAGVEVTFRK